MKKNRLILLGLVFLLVYNKGSAQSTTANNLWAFPKFIGYNATNGVNPLNFRTNNIHRMQMNGNITTNINAQGPLQKNGCVGLGEVPGFYQFFGGTGPFSLLHLNGNNFLGTPQTGGYRNWMRYGIVTTHNQDLAFMGQRATGGNDITDMVFSWADNAGSGFPGPDNMVFSFLAGTGAANNDLTGDAPNGREVVRYTGTGNVGVGPRFNNANQPKSTFHQHQENALSSWMQITNQRMTVATPVPGPTVINPANGLRIGIFGDNVLAQNGDALMYNQENRHLIFSTNHATPGNILTTDERMRISSLSAPTENPSGGFSAGGYNPGGILFADATRVGLSYLPALPVTAPLSLVHMGGNTSATNDGWRNWMDIGTFVHLPTIGGVPGGHFYSGMRFAGTATGLTAPRDAIINWGFSPPTAVSPGNRLRFIFTTTAGGPFLSSGANGLEAGHFVSDGNNPRFGVGIFSGAGVDPLNTLEIMSSASSPYFASANGSSGLKFRNMNSLVTPVVNPGQGVLALDNAGNVIYVNSSSSSTGCCLGNPCIGAPNPLPGNWSIPMNANNFFFLGNGGPGQDRVGIGFGFCNPPPQARLHVMQNSGVNNDVGILSDNSCTDAIALRARAGGSATGPQTKVAGWFEASGAAGAAQVAIYVPQGSGLVNIGYPTPSSVGAGGGLLNVNGSGAFNGDVFPVIDCNPAQRCGNPTNRWFEVWSCNGAIQTSDERLKENMKPLSYGMEQIMKLKPISYTWKGNAGYGTKIGFVAQQLKEVIGEVVKEGDDPNKTLGVNYAELVPVLIKGMQEQQVQIEAKSQQNDDLKKLIESQQKQIDELRNMITSCCSNANPAANNKAVAQINVELKDGDAVVLNQNVPNPFAEQTVISYNIPEKIQSAQIIFYNNLGQVLKTIDIKTRGKGQLNVYANDLTNGLYSYSLIVDGKIADTKKMIRQN